MIVGVYTFEVHLPRSHSLKEKRVVMRRLKDRLRARYNVAVMELSDHNELWQRGALAIVSLADRRDPLERLFDGVRREAEGHVPGQIIDTGTEFIEGADGGPGGWSGDDWS